MDEAGAELCRRLELKGRKKSHRLTVASDLRNHIVPFFGDRTLDRITPDDIERYIAVKQRTLAIKTIRNHIVTMHSVFEVGLRKGWCQSNPVKLADRPVIRTTETRIKFLDQDELEKLLAVPYPDDAFGRIEPTLYLTAAMTGLRQGELLGLRWRDVDFEARRVRVVSPFVRGEFGDPKSEGSGRSVPLAERAAVALARTTRAVDVPARPRPRVLPPGHGQPARPLEARPSLQAGHRASRRPPRHLPRTAPHVRDAHGRGGHAAADAAALDGTRRLEDHPGLRALPAVRRRGGRRRPRIRVISVTQAGGGR